MNTSRSSGEQFVLDAAPRIPARGGSTKTRIFNGLTRRTADWDGLRRDPQLWSDNADCLVHFYAYGTSQRGASLRIPLEAIKKLNCPYLLEYCYQPRSITQNGGRDSGYLSTASTDSDTEYPHCLHISAPLNLPRKEAFAYHITTRNVIAYAVGKPVVGERLSLALIDLWRRLKSWTHNRGLRETFTRYLSDQGYLNFTENAEHALACLKFAEELHFRDIWVDAFAHAAGLHATLDLSPEFAGLSKTTAALLTRASLEMDLHIGRVIKALGGFLEEELGADVLGLSKPARDHLDSFRSFLHTYYVERFGWFPPPQRHTWNKRPWREMYHDFQALYDYLVDYESSQDWTSNRVLSGGICVIQNVQAFDARHGYEPLPHPLPLLPESPNVKRRRSISSQTALRNFKLGRASTIPETKITAHQALLTASNAINIGGAPHEMVHEYQRFERQKLDSKLDMVEARKVRWLLIYSVLQMLSSIMKGPKEVRDAETPSYPVCVLTTGCPVFEDDDEETAAVEAESDLPSLTPVATVVPDALDALEGRSSRISIHPDCEADCADDYFAATAISRRESELSLDRLALQSRPVAPLSRTGSFRNSMQTSVHALQRSLVGSLTRRNSKRVSALAETKQKPLYREILIEDYGNGALAQTEDDHRPQTAVRVVDGAILEARDALQGFDFGFTSTPTEPVLEHTQLGLQTTGLANAQVFEQSPRDSQFSGASTELSESNRSSYMLDDGEGSDTEMSSVASDVGRSDSNRSGQGKPAPVYEDTDAECILLKEHLTHRPKAKGREFGVATTCWSVNAGCYTPTGMILPPRSKFASRERPSSSRSTTSSNYAEECTQAADIEEDELRGRQRSRAMDSFVRHGPPAKGVMAY